MTSTFGADHSLATVLRFPVFVGSFTTEGTDALLRLRDQLPANLKRFIAEFHHGLEDEIAADSRFELRLRVVLEQVELQGERRLGSQPRKRSRLATRRLNLELSTGMMWRLAPCDFVVGGLHPGERCAAASPRRGRLARTTKHLPLARRPRGARWQLGLRWDRTNRACASTTVFVPSRHFIRARGKPTFGPRASTRSLAGAVVLARDCQSGSAPKVHEHSFSWGFVGETSSTMVHC